MYFDRRLWELTKGLRGRIALAILVGLVAAAFGIARFVLLGALLARVFTGAGFTVIAVLAAGVAAAVLLRAWLDDARTMIAHRNAARVQQDLRGRLYDKIAELGPAWFAGERTGGVMLSVVDGVEQLQSFFGQYLPQVAVAALTPIAIFLFIVWWDVPVAAVMLVGGAGNAVRADGFEPDRGRARPRAPRGDEGVRLGVPRRGAGPADLEGVRPEHRLRQAARRAGARIGRDDDARPLDQRDDARHHRLRRRARRRGGPGARRLARLARVDDDRGLADRADGRHRGVPAIARPACGACTRA